MSTIEAKTDTYNLEQMVPINSVFFLKITKTGIIITKKEPVFAGTGIPVRH